MRNKGIVLAVLGVAAMGLSACGSPYGGYRQAAYQPRYVYYPQQQPQSWGPPPQQQVYSQPAPVYAQPAPVYAAPQPSYGYGGGGSGGLVSKEMGGAVLGGIGGAVAGAQFGKGTGRLAATALGTLLGAGIGSSVGGSLDRADQMYYGQ